MVFQAAAVGRSYVNGWEAAPITFLIGIFVRTEHKGEPTERAVTGERCSVLVGLDLHVPAALFILQNSSSRRDLAYGSSLKAQHFESASLDSRPIGGHS
jgi:hypothetical protein